MRERIAIKEDWLDDDHYDQMKLDALDTEYVPDEDHSQGETSITVAVKNINLTDIFNNDARELKRLEQQLDNIEKTIEVQDNDIYIDNLADVVLDADWAMDQANIDALPNGPVDFEIEVPVKYEYDYADSEWRFGTTWDGQIKLLKIEPSKITESTKPSVREAHGKVCESPSKFGTLRIFLDKDNKANKEDIDFLNSLSKTFHANGRQSFSDQYTMTIYDDDIDDLKRKAKNVMDNINRNVKSLKGYKNDSIFKESLQNEDGWSDEVTDVLEPPIEEVEELAYELRNTVRGAKTGAKTVGQLVDKVDEIANELESASSELEDNEDELNESTNKDISAEEYQDKVKEAILQAIYGYYAHKGWTKKEVDSYIMPVVDTDFHPEFADDGSDALFVEVRAELDYDELGDLGAHLDKTITKFDKWAYFEPYMSGITQAVIFRNNPKHESIEEEYEGDRYEMIDHKMVYDSDGFTTDYTLYFDHDENNYFTVFGDNDLYGPEDSDHDWDFGPNEDEALEWFEDYEGFNDEDDVDLELTDDDLEAGQWYESLNETLGTKAVSLDEVLKEAEELAKDLLQARGAKEQREDYARDVYYTYARELRAVPHKGSDGRDYVYTDANKNHYKLNLKYISSAMHGNLASWYANAIRVNDISPAEWQRAVDKMIKDKFVEKYGVLDESLKESLLYRDNGAGLADKGYLFTIQELGKIYDDSVKAKDPVVMEYKNFSDWMNDTVESGLLEIVDERAFDESLNEDTVKRGNSWVNKGKAGTHGKFRTKKAADAQRKAMFAQGYTVKESRDINEADEELDRKGFMSVLKYGDEPWEGYAILNDGYFVKRIYAESDEDAINQFHDYLDGKEINEGVEDIPNWFKSLYYEAKEKFPSSTQKDTSEQCKYIYDNTDMHDNTLLKWRLAMQKEYYKDKGGKEFVWGGKPSLSPSGKAIQPKVSAIGEELDDDDGYQEVSGRNGYRLFRKIENGKGKWRAQKCVNGKCEGEPFDITYEQALGREPIEDKPIAELSKKLGKILLPKNK